MPFLTPFLRYNRPMRAIVQRVKYAKCHIDAKVYSEIKQGFLVLVGFKDSDNGSEIVKVAKKVAKLRVFADEEGKMNKDLKSVNGAILSISQFTLYGDCAKGNRPSFIAAKEPVAASAMYDAFNAELRTYGIEVQTGIFQSDMQIESVNDGPVTIIIDSDAL